MMDTPPTGAAPAVARRSLARRIHDLVRAIRTSDAGTIEAAIVSLAQSRRIFAPLGLVVGAFVMLFDGLKLLVTNWRLTLIQALPALWIWLAMFNLKVHVLKGRGFYGWRGGAALAMVLLAVVLTAASFYLNGVFAFAIAGTSAPALRPAFATARRHAKTLVGSGSAVGFALGLAAIVAPRAGLGWFTIAMSIVIGVLMFCYVAIPSRLLGIDTRDTALTRRESLAATALGGFVGALVCAPPYAIARLGVLLLATNTVLGVVLLTFGTVLQAGATGSVKAIQMSAKIKAARPAA